MVIFLISMFWRVMPSWNFISRQLGEYMVSLQNHVFNQSCILVTYSINVLGCISDNQPQFGDKKSNECLQKATTIRTQLELSY